MNQNTRCGFVAILGRPNVGKSTLLNKILGKKVSITSHRPQTTRHQIQGIKTNDNVQTIFVDTPGMHQSEHKRINQYMNKAASSAIRDVDLVLFIIDANRFSQEDEFVLSLIKKTQVPTILVINKIDTIQDKEKLLPLMERLSQQYAFHQVVPVSAVSGLQVAHLEQAIENMMPESPFYFPIDAVSNRGKSFQISELVREKIMRTIAQEVPYASTVQVEKITTGEKITEIDALIWVERDSQKKIIIGEKGDNLKTIGTHARQDIEKYLNTKVMLRLWVKVKKDWTDNQKLLTEFGLAEHLE